MNLTLGAQKLKAWMQRNELTQTDVAERLTKARNGQRVYQATVSEWLRGSQLPIWAAVAFRKEAKIPIEDWTVPAEESGPDVARAAAKAG
jgi:transcriptional regulator with XRE-family HTH domain